MNSECCICVSIIDVVSCSKLQAKTISDEVKVDADTLSKEVHDILEAKGIGMYMQIHNDWICIHVCAYIRSCNSDTS